MSESTGASRGGSLRSALAHREFRLVAAALAVSAAGNWLYNIALLVFVFDRTGSTGWVAAASILRLLPMMLFSPLGGAIADRFERRSVMITSDLARALLMGGLTFVAFASGPPALAIALAFLATTAGTPYGPATGAITPSLVSEDDLASANAVTATITYVALVVGPALGGVLLVIGSPAVAFLVNAASFALSALLVLAVHTRSKPEVADGRVGLLTTVIEGARAMRAGGAASAIAGFTMAASFLYGAETVLLVLVSERLLGTGSRGLGYLFAAVGLGGLLAAALTPRVTARARPAAPLVASLVAMGVPLAVLPVVHVAALAFALMTVQGVGLVIVDVVVVTVLQRALPQSVVGRVFGIVDALVIATTLLGSLLAPALVAAISLSGALLLIGLGLPALAVALLPLLGGVGAVAERRMRELSPTVSLLAEVGVFSGLRRPALEQLAAAAVAESVPAGTAVVRQGEAAHDFFVVRAGQLSVSSSGAAGGPEQPVATLGAGDWFGEIGLLESVPRTATVTAISDCDLLRISGGDFLDVVNQAPLLTATLRDAVTTRMARTHPAWSGAAAQGSAG